MAYITADEVKVIRDELKETFPEFKFSVRRDGHSGIIVTIMEGPIRFANQDDVEFNQFHIERHKNSSILKAMLAIINKNNFDKSDSSSDYFHVGYWVSFGQGRWDKPFKLRPFKNDAQEVAFFLKWPEVKA